MNYEAIETDAVECIIWNPSSGLNVTDAHVANQVAIMLGGECSGMADGEENTWFVDMPLTVAKRLRSGECIEVAVDDRLLVIEVA